MHKHKHISAAVAFAALIVATLDVSAADAGTTGFFVEGRAGTSSIDFGPLDDDDTALQLTGGYRWNGFGVEVGYVDFGDFSSGVTAIRSNVGGGTTRIPGRVDAAFDGFVVGVNERENFTNSPWYISGRLGILAWNVDVATQFDDTPRATSDGKGTDWYAGLGLGYDISERFSISAAYDYFRVESDDVDGSLKTLSLTGEWRF